MHSQPELKFQKSSIFVKWRPRKRRPKLVSKTAILEVLIITGLKSNATLCVVDRNVAIFTTRHAMNRYEFQVSQGNYSKIRLNSASPNKVR